MVELQPQERPCSATISSGTRPTASMIAPGQSMRAPARGTCGTLSTLATTTSATTPIGTLTRKIQRHPSMPRMVFAPARRPPITGPSTLDVAKTARNMPW